MSVMRDRKSFDPEDVRRQIKALGARMGPPVLEPTQALFDPLHPSAPYPGVTVTRDHRYGPHERHRLDVFRGESVTKRPVLLFVHGGGFIGGDKKLPDQPYYDNVGVWVARSGFVGVMMTYRLAPEHPWPAGPEDIARAIAWVKVNIAAHGGDPARVFLMGHSAGAAHAAAYAAQARFHASDGHGLAGLIVVAGLYDIARFERSPNVESYYGAKPELYAERSALPQMKSVKVPVMIAVGEHEAPGFERQALALTQAVFERDGRLPRFARLHGQNHYSELFSFGLDYCPDLARHVRDFIEIDCA
jgi:acetyl esterase/lipase